MTTKGDKGEKEYAKAFDEMASLAVIRAEISRKPDGKLALWHAAQKPGSPEFILAEHEWRSRLLAKQNRAIYVAAVLGIAGVVIGVLLGWYLSSGSS